jgi:6-phospho-beta-glucosidase
MRIVVIGGSGQSTPNLFAYLGRNKRSLPAGLEVVLLGRSEHRLAAVHRASRLLLEGADVQVHAARTGHCLGAALAGADVVVIQVRIGGYEGRIFDESLLSVHGLCGDEEISPASLAAAWRSWPELERILYALSVSSPRAQVIILSSPVSLLVRASRRRFPDLQTYGICEVPWSMLTEIAAATGVSPFAVQFGYHGVSHFGWFYDIEAAGRDLAREYLMSGAGIDQRSAWWSRLPAVATRFVRVQYQNEVAVEGQCNQGTPRGLALRAIRLQSMRVFAQGTPAEIRAVLQMRPAPWYDQAIGPLLLALAGAHLNRPTVFLSMPNQGAYKHLKNDDILELPYRVRLGAFDRLPTIGSAPARVCTEVERHIQYQREATEAFMARNLLRLQSALELHPWVKSRARVRGMTAVIRREFPS